MSSKQTGNSPEKKQMPEGWSPFQIAGGKTKVSKLTQEEIEAGYQKMVEDGVVDGTSPKREISDEIEGGIGTNEAIQQEDRNDTLDSLQTKVTGTSEPKEATVPITASKRTTTKQRKESLEEYREAFLTVPKLEDRKPVFISREVRDSIDEIVHRLGGRGRSVSGFIENLARHHLESYREDVEQWKKL